MRQKDKRKIKKLLIDAMAFLKVEAYTGVYEACEQITTIIDEFEYDNILDGDEED